MWTKYISIIYLGNSKEWSVVYFECNEPCARLFFRDMYPAIFDYYILAPFPGTPTIENVKEYVIKDSVDYEYTVRVFSMGELKELGYIEKDSLYPTYR